MAAEGIGDLRKSIESLVDLFTEWFIAAIHPIQTCERLLIIEDEAERWRGIFRLWCVAFLVTIMVDLPLYQPYGIGLESIGFHASCLMCLTLTMIACGFGVSVSLRIYGIRSSFSETTSVYAAFVMFYQPLVALLSYPSYIRLFDNLKMAKLQGLSLGGAIRLLIAKAPAISSSHDFISVLNGIFVCLLLVFSCVTSVLMASVISDRFSMQKLKCFAAFGFAHAFFLPLILSAQGIVYAFIVLRFMVPTVSPAATH